MKPKLILVALFMTAASVRGDVVDLGAFQDTSIFATKPTNSDGGGAGIFAGTDAGGGVKRALIEFNFSNIPAGSIITNVQLTLTFGMSPGGGPATSTIGLFDVLDSWGEGTTGNPTSDSSGIGGSGNGFTANAGDATWSSRFSGSTAWTTAGGDHSGTASASTTGNNTTNSTFVWSSTQMVSDVQGWLTNSSTNNGWELINANESSASTFTAFYSREWGTFTAAGGNAAQEPVLQVTYVPEPATGILLAGACLGVLSLRPFCRRS
jgi:hypothetical protein